MLTPGWGWPLFQGAGYNGWTSGRQNAQNLDLNRNFPDLTSEFYRLASTRGTRTNHIAIPQHYWWGKVGAPRHARPGGPGPQLRIRQRGLSCPRTLRCGPSPGQESLVVKAVPLGTAARWVLRAPRAWQVLGDRGPGRLPGGSDIPQRQEDWQAGGPAGAGALWCLTASWRLGVGPGWSAGSRPVLRTGLPSWAGGPRDQGNNEVDADCPLRALGQPPRGRPGGVLPLRLLQAPPRGEDVFSHA